MNNDKWLDRWLPLIKEKCAGESVLEIGCGWGWDTKVFADAGLSVIGIDVSEEYLEQAKVLAPSATFFLQDMNHGLFNTEDKYNVIIASLSMHYMPLEDTAKTISRVRDSLVDNGLFLFRVNSVKDVNHGAVGNSEINKKFFLVNGKPKMFFDEPTIRKLFDNGWKIISLEELTIDRFEKPKVVWELIAKKR